jgi:hypothetical protein
MSLSSLRIIVTGLIAQHPQLGGLTWAYIQYLLGLARLGHDVYYLEDSGVSPYRLDGSVGRAALTGSGAANARYLRAVMRRIGLDQRWAYRCASTAEWFGLGDAARRELLQSADLVLNVSGALARPQDYRRGARLVYVDTDPVFTQVKLLLPRGHTKFHGRVDAHDRHFTFGECLSKPYSATGHRWRGTRQPIVLTEWRPSPPPRRVFTTVLNWTSYRPLCFKGRVYGQKDVELRRFLDLPSRVRSTSFEIALNRTANLRWGASGRRDRTVPRALLRAAGWRTVDATRVCRDPDRYRRYIYSSMAEWSVAKHGYVMGQPGWFSERSACYLAAGRPVVVQDTGFAAVIPTGDGVIRFADLDGAVAAVEEVLERYGRHAAAARGIAETWFDSDRVLAHLLTGAFDTANTASSRGKDHGTVVSRC